MSPAWVRQSMGRVGSNAATELFSPSSNTRCYFGTTSPRRRRPVRLSPPGTATSTRPDARTARPGLLPPVDCEKIATIRPDAAYKEVFTSAREAQTACLVGLGRSPVSSRQTEFPGMNFQYRSGIHGDSVPSLVIRVCRCVRANVQSRLCSSDRRMAERAGCDGRSRLPSAPTERAARSERDRPSWPEGGAGCRL